MFKALLLSSLVLNLGLLVGRLSGFAREAFVAFNYGVTAEADIVVLMFTVPDLMVNILMGGALGAVLIPEFTERSEQACQVLYQSLLFFGMMFVAVAGILYWQTGALATLLVPGFAEVQRAQAAVAIGWVIWLVPLTVSAGVVTAFLHATNRFAVAALGTLIINSTIIIGLLLVYFGYGSLQLVAVFVLLGGLFRLVSQLLQVRPTWSPLESLFPWRLNRTLLVRYGQAMLSGSVLLLFPVVARALASYETEGSVSLFNYATRLVEFPLAIAVTFLAAVFFPRLSQSFIDEPVQHRQLIRYGVQITLGLSLLAAITLGALSHAYAGVVYGRGNMQVDRLAQIGDLITIGLASLPLQGLSSFLTAVFNSRKDTRTPLFLNGIGLGVFLLASNAGVFGQGLKALMWGMVVSYGLICVLQFMFLKIEALSWRNILFDRMYLLGSVCAVVILTYTSRWVVQSDFSDWFSLLLAGFCALLSLSVMVLFNEELRSLLKARLSAK